MIEPQDSDSLAEVIRFLNEAQSAEELLPTLKEAGTAAAEKDLAHALISKRASGGAFRRNLDSSCRFSRPGVGSTTGGA